VTGTAGFTRSTGPAGSLGFIGSIESAVPVALLAGPASLPERVTATLLLSGLFPGLFARPAARPCLCLRLAVLWPSLAATPVGHDPDGIADWLLVCRHGCGYL